MQTKTIKKVIFSKLTEWLETITDQNLRKDVKDNIVVSGGCITSMFLNIPVNDYDIYIQKMDVLIRLAEYYCKPNNIRVLDGRKREFYLREYFKEKYGNNDIEFAMDPERLKEDLSEYVVRIKNLKPDQIRLDVSSVGARFDKDESKNYHPVFISPNAISLTDEIQIVVRFSGTPEEIHKTFDFIHATNYFTFKDGLVTNIPALESVLTKQLKYQGSFYPLTSIIRMKKFLKRNWNIGAGEMLKIMFQISELDLSDPEILEEQLIGVDIAYFAKLIEILKNLDENKISSSYINTIIDKVFENYEEQEPKINEE